MVVRYLYIFLHIVCGSFKLIACFIGGGPLGHPKVYINLDKPGAHPCGYCKLSHCLDIKHFAHIECVIGGVRFQLEHHH